MSKINLQTLGFSAKFAEEAASFGCFPVGRVSAQYKDLYRVITETGGSTGRGFRQAAL